MLNTVKNKEEDFKKNLITLYIIALSAGWEIVYNPLSAKQKPPNGGFCF